MWNLASPYHTEVNTACACTIINGLPFTGFHAGIEKIQMAMHISATGHQIHFIFGLKGKGRYSFSWEPHLRATDVTCHMGSHSVTGHPTQVNAPRLTPAMQAGTRFTYPGGMEG